MRTFVLSLAVGWLAANLALAGEACKAPAACSEAQTCGSPNCCAHCGCCCPCEKYCRVVCEMKEVKKTCWVVKCQDFCAPLPGSRRDCREGGEGQGTCSAEAACPNECGCKCNPCAQEEKKCYVPPKCGRVREKKTLEKKEIVCLVPSYKCVVVYCCPNCGADHACGGQQTPPPPPSSAKPTLPVAPSPVPHKTT